MFMLVRVEICKNNRVLCCHLHLFFFSVRNSEISMKFSLSAKEHNDITVYYVLVITIKMRSWPFQTMPINIINQSLKSGG